MIRLYSGLPGSGKTYSSLRYMRNALSKKHIFSNIMLDDSFFRKGRHDYKDHYHFVDYHMLKPQELIDFSKEYFSGRKVIEGGLIVVIDEAQLFFNSRTWDHNQRFEWLKFFSYHRHYGYDILLITQSDRFLDKQLRMLIEYETVHKKVSNYNILFTLISFLTFHSTMFVAITFWHSVRERVDLTFFFLSRKYMKFYNTH